MSASVRVYLSECNKLLLLQPVAVIIVVASAAWLPLYLFSIVAALVSDAACNRTSKCENDTEKAPFNCWPITSSKRSGRKKWYEFYSINRRCEGIHISSKRTKH